MRSGGGRGGREEGELAVHGLKQRQKKPNPSRGGQRGLKDGVTTKNKKRQERCSTYGTGLAGAGSTKAGETWRRDGNWGVVAVIEAGGTDTEWTRQKVDN